MSVPRSFQKAWNICPAWTPATGTHMPTRSRVKVLNTAALMFELARVGT